MSDAAPFRCSAAARSRGDALAGTASTVRSFLLVENAGPWGRDALVDGRLPEGVGVELKSRAQAAGVRSLLIRRGGRSGTDTGIRVYAAHAVPGRTFLATRVLSSYHALLDLDLSSLGRGERPAGWRPDPGPVYAACTHGKHDTCCAERGRPVAAALREAGVHGAWEVSHIGGDRFAGNLLVLPWGLYYGGLNPENVLRVAAAHRRGEVELDLLRGRSAYPMPVQYAEIALRRQLDEVRIGALSLRSSETDGALTSACFEHEGRSWTVQVRTRAPQEARLTCAALRENPVPQHELVSLDRE